MAANVRPRDRSAIRARGGGSGIAGLASFAPDFFNNPTLVDPKTGLAISLTRATTATYTDQDLIVRTALAGMARMQGMRVVRNLFTFTEAFTNAAWLKLNAPTVTTGVTDPLGGTTAFTLTATAANGYLYQGAGVVGSTQTTSCWIRRRTGTGAFLLGDNTVLTTQITSAWQRLSVTEVVSFGTPSLAALVSGDAFDLWHPQCENVTGQSNQNPGEYQSVGVMSSPYQGLGVDGAKAYATLNGNTVASNVVTEAVGQPISTDGDWGALQGVSGSYFSTPDSVANSITGDIDIRCKLAMNDWTPATEAGVVGKIQAPISNYALALLASGALRFYVSMDGTTYGINTDSTVSTGFIDGTTHYIRVTRSQSLGEVKFYTSDDGVSWTQLGTTKTGLSTAAGFDGFAFLEIGAYFGGANTVAGKIYRSQILSGINGTLAVDFNPNSWTTGTTWTSATSEVWTIQGNASVQGPSNQGFLVEPAATNKLLQSRTLNHASWSNTTTTVAASATVAPDGTLGAWDLTSGGAGSRLTQQVTATATTEIYSAWFKKFGATNNVEVLLYNVTTATALAYADLNLTTGAVTTYLGAAVGFAGGNNWFRISINNTAGLSIGNVVQVYIYAGLAGSTAGDKITAWNTQEETGSKATSDIFTTTAAVTRNADVATIATGSWYNALAGSLYTEWLNPANAAIGVPSSLNDTTNNNIIDSFVQSITNYTMQVKVAGATQASFNGVAIVGGAITKDIKIYAANDFTGYANGVLMGADTSGTVPTVTRLEIGSGGGSFQINSTIRAVRYYPYRMNNVTAQNLTV